MADNREALAPALQQLSRVTDILARNRAALGQTVDNLAPFVRVFTNTLGNGRWFDSFVNDLLPTALGSVPLHRRRGRPRRRLLGRWQMSGTLQRGVALAASLVLLAAVAWTVLQAGRPVPRHRLVRPDRGALLRSPTSAFWASPSARSTEVLPLGDRVRVRMVIDEDYDIPADAAAVVLAPFWSPTGTSSSRLCTTAGPTMEDGDEVPLDRTATPVELDRVYGALDELSAALGPDGANADGALSDLIDTGAANLEGNGEALNRTLTGFSPRGRDPGRQPRRPLRARWTTCRPSPAHWPPSTPRSVEVTTTWRRSSEQAGRRAGGPRRGDRPAERRAGATSPASSRTTPRC